jgi:hypothetical protein
MMRADPPDIQRGRVLTDGVVEGGWKDDALKVTFLALIGVVIVLLCYAYNLLTTTELPGMLPDPDPIPYAELRTSGLAHYTDWTDDPAAVSVLGNATSAQCVAVLDVQGRLWAMTSDDLFVNASRRCMLADLGDGPFDGATLQLGRTAEGAFGLRLSYDGTQSYWVMVGGPAGWRREAGIVQLEFPQTVRVDATKLPYPKNLSYDEASVDALRVDGADVVVTAYSYCGGCVDVDVFPSVVFTTDEGRWSNIVRVQSVNHHIWGSTCYVAGTSLDDLFIVIVSRDDSPPSWSIVPLAGDGLRQAGTRAIA